MMRQKWATPQLSRGTDTNKTIPGSTPFDAPRSPRLAPMRLILCRLHHGRGWQGRDAAVVPLVLGKQEAVSGVY